MTPPARESASPLDLHEFMLAMSRQPPSALTHDRLMDLAHGLRLPDELLELHTHFTTEAYARNLVCRTPAFELLVLCWLPGQESTIHDHAGALNAISVRRGMLTSRRFAPVDGKPQGEGPVELVGDEGVPPGRWIGVDRTGIHQLANTTADGLVTVHIYTPPLMDLVVYSTESPVVERRPLRYRISDDL